MTIPGSTSRGRNVPSPSPSSPSTSLRVFPVYISMPRAASSRGEEAKNKSARKRALMDETSFQPHGALLLPPYFLPPFVNIPATHRHATPRRAVRSFVGLRWNNTDHVDLSTSSYIPSLKFMRPSLHRRGRRWRLESHGQEKHKKRED